MKVTLYTKPECSLCDEAKEVLAQVRAEIPFDLDEVDIRGDPQLFDRFRYDIPVVFVDGHKAFKHRVDPKALRERLRK